MKAARALVQCFQVGFLVAKTETSHRGISCFGFLLFRTAGCWILVVKKLQAVLFSKDLKQKDPGNLFLSDFFSTSRWLYMAL